MFGGTCNSVARVNPLNLLRMAYRQLRAVIVLVHAGCGPTVATQGETGSTSSPTSNSTSTGFSSVDATSASTTATSSTPTVTTSAPPPPQTTSESSSSGDDGPTLDRCECNFLCPPCPEKGCPGYDQFCNETFECDVIAQNCGEGEKCMPWANDGGFLWNATRCTPIARDPDQVGEACEVEGYVSSGIDSCDASQMCFNAAIEGLTGTCVGFCAGPLQDPTCPDGQACSISNEDILALCLPACDPLLATCADGEGCFPSGTDSFVCLPAPSQSIASLFTCHLSGGCDPGTICLDSFFLPDCEDEGGCCSPYCDLTEPVCPQRTDCLPFFEEGAVPQFEDVGVCALPL